MSEFSQQVENKIMLDDIEENLGIQAVEFLEEKTVDGETWVLTRIKHPHGDYLSWTTIVHGEIVFADEEDLFN
jgi:hypothetical protein